MNCLRTVGIIFLLKVVYVGMAAYSQPLPPLKSVTVDIDGKKTFQKIAGIGVNANTASWDANELKPAISLLLDSMHATLWRVIVETVYQWEERNDNNDPFTFNWDYYNKLYETPKFQKVWEMVAYLNRKGVTKSLMIDFMGPIPLWMGGNVVKEKFEDEYIEMLVSFFYYAINVKHLQIGLISIMNEPDIENEGPTVDAKQYVRLFRRFTDRMHVLGLGDVKYVAPDVAGLDNALDTYLPELMKDTIAMSKIAHIGLHSYGGYYAPIDSFIKHSSFPQYDFWMTEWNNWCKGCDDGRLGEYNYQFAAKSVEYLLDCWRNNATAGLVWEGYDSYYEHHAPSPFSYWGMLAYNPVSKTYIPRKNFYALRQISQFVLPGFRRVSVSMKADSLPMLAFRGDAPGEFSLIGVNKSEHPVLLKGSLNQMPVLKRLAVYYTDSTENVRKGIDAKLNHLNFEAAIPAKCIFTITGLSEPKQRLSLQNRGPEPSNWYSGDIHVHLNCGEGTTTLPEEELVAKMEQNDLDVISVLADMGNGEVQDSKRDLPKVTGEDVKQPDSGRIIHWDAEWHWDATYSNFSNQALGGHLVLLGLKNAHQIWEESPYKILDWARKQNAITGFAHLEYLNGSIQNELNCCIPIDYPVEVALGNVDFLSQDVFGKTSPNNGNYFSEGTIQAFYKLLNCGFRPGLAAGTDYPCNDNEPLGNLLTYVFVRDSLTYQKWIEGIKAGRTVISRNGHKEFLDLKLNGKYIPGDEIKTKRPISVNAKVTWTVVDTFTGTIEIISNGKVVASRTGTATKDRPLIFNATIPISMSGWLCARRMDEKGHQSHTSPVYITVNEKPVRARAEDARYFIDWIDNILNNIKAGGKWNKYFPHDLNEATDRYRKARDIYVQVLKACEDK